MDGHISSNILSTGNKFIVTDKISDSTFGHRTIGITSYVKGIDTSCANVVYIHAIILKRGKQGKHRLDIESLSLPIFNFETMSSSIIMPDKKRKYYVNTEPHITNLCTIYNMTNLDYLGWALSWACYLNQLSQYTKPFNIWPTKHKNIMNKMFRASDYWQEDSACLSDVYGALDKRTEFIKQMRIMEMTLTARSLTYMLKVAKLETQAIKYLIAHNHKTKIEDKKRLETTYKFFMKKYTNLKLLKEKNTTPLKKKLMFPF